MALAASIREAAVILDLYEAAISSVSWNSEIEYFVSHN
jgi:hypothetical protein